MVMLTLQGCSVKTCKYSVGLQPVLFPNIKSDFLGAQVSIDKQTGFFIVDTGANISIVSPALLKKIDGANPQILIKNNKKQYENVLYFDAKSISVGGYEKKNKRIYSMNLENLRMPIDGILGFDFLSSAGFEFNPELNALSLSPSKAVGVKFPLKIKNRLPYITIYINNCPFSMMIDTGANAVSFNDESWGKVVSCSNGTLSKQELSNSTVKSYVSASLVDTIDIEINLKSQPKHKVIAQRGGHLINGDMNILGVDFLKNYAITYFKKSNYIYFDEIKF